MTSREKDLQEIILRLQRIIDKHLQIKNVPLVVDENLVLAPGEIHVLQAIGENQGCNVTSLGEFLGVTKSAVSQMVTKLIKKDVVRKVAAPDNGKEKLLFLSEVGHRAFMIHQAFHLRHMTTLLGHLEKFPDNAIFDTCVILKEIEHTVDDRIDDIFNRGEASSRS